jgi:hypothetical protein
MFFFTSKLSHIEMQTDVMSQLVYRAVLTLDEKKEGKNRHRIFFRVFLTMQ